MKKLFLVWVVTFIALCTDKINAQANSSSLLRHIVIITFKQEAPADSIKALDDIYVDLSRGSMVKEFETGVNISSRDTGVVRHVYMTSFASKEDMDNYRKIPEYSQLFKVSLPIATEVTVADYWVMRRP